MNNQNQGLNMQAASIVKAIAHTENGGTPDFANPSAGKTGEMKSVFQFEPATWKAYAKQISGDENLPMTPENESLITYSKVNDWLQKGYNPKQIASMWNAGPGEPDAYTGKFSDGSSSVGVNKKYGVKYDVPGYADKVDSLTQQFLSKGGQTAPQANTPTNTPSSPQISSKPPVFKNQTNEIKGSPFSRVMAKKSNNKIKNE